MTHAFTQPDHVEIEMTEAEAHQDWFEEWMGQWLSDQSDEGYDVALAMIEQREHQMRGTLSDSRSNTRETAL